MSLVERSLPVNFRHDYSFFDQLFSGMAVEMDEFEQDMQRVRERMFQLVPHDDMDTARMQMDVSTLRITTL